MLDGRPGKSCISSLGLPVYLLQAKIAERFALEATPTMIEAAPDGRSRSWSPRTFLHPSEDPS